MKAMASPRGAGKIGIKGRITPDTNVEGNSRFTISTGADGTGVGSFRLDMTPAGVISTVGGLYQQFLFKPGTTFNYVPSVGLTSPGNVMVGWLDNPELISQYIDGSTATKISIVQSLANIKIYPIWERFTYALTAPPRMKRFDVNDTFTVGASNPSEFQRSCQGMFVYYVFGYLASATNVSQSYVHQKVQLWGLTSQYGT